MTQHGQKLRGILGERALLDAYADIVVLLRDAVFSHGDGFEKLKQGAFGGIYSLRLNKGARLLVSKVSIEGFEYWVMLEALLKHEYQRSVFLKPGGLSAYYKKMMPDLTAQAHCLQSMAGAYELKEDGACSSSSACIEPSKFCLTELEYYNNNLIILNHSQNEAMRASQPLIVSGMPGSGKSCVAMSLIFQCIEESNLKYIEAKALNSDAKPLKILYVTPLLKLAQSMRAMYLSSPSVDGFDADLVDYLSYAELLERLHPDTHARTKVSLDEFKVWLDAYLDLLKHKVLKQDFLSDFQDAFCLANALYQEFRIIVGLLNIEAYLALGQRQSLFTVKAQRVLIYDMFKAYMAFLEQHHQLDFSFYPITQRGVYGHVIVDEAQDFSYLQSRAFQGLAKDNKVSYFLDSNQSLLDNLSKIQFLIEILGQSSHHIKLDYSMRCPKSVVKLANAALSVKYQLTGGLVDKHSEAFVRADEQADEGHVSWLQTIDEASLLELKRASASARCALVTRPEYVAEARALLPAVNVLTVFEAKGLEYEFVIAYRLLDRPIFEEMNRRLSTNVSCSSTKAIGRAKKGAAHDEYGPPFNELFTSFTRTTHSLIIINESKHGLRYLQAMLKDAITSKEGAIKAVLVASSEADWLEEAMRQLRVANIDVAKRICFEHLKYDEPQFAALNILINPTPASSSGREVIDALQATFAPAPASAASVLAEALPCSVVAAPLKSKRQIYVENFWKDNGNYQSNLQKMLKHSHLIAFLFDTLLEDGRSLIEHIAEQESKYHALCVLLAPNNGFLDEDAPLKLLSDHCLYLSHQNQGTKKWLAFSILALHAHAPIFKTLFVSEELAINVLTDTLCRCLGPGSGFYANTSPLYWFCMIEEGRVFFFQLLSYYPNVAKLITAEALCRPRGSAAGGLENASALYGLSCSDLGHNILLNILNIKPCLAQEISDEALYRPVFAEHNRYAYKMLHISLVGLKIIGLLQQAKKLLSATQISEHGFFAATHPITQGNDQALQVALNQGPMR